MDVKATLRIVDRKHQQEQKKKTITKSRVGHVLVLPECNVEPCHVVSHVTVEVDQHVSGFTDHFRHLLN